MPRLAESPKKSAPRTPGSRTPRSSTVLRSAVPALSTPGRAVLADVTWSEYVALRDRPGNARLKMTYDGPAGGLLEIEMPRGSLHENVSWLLTLLIAAFAEERRSPVRSFGEFTQRREDLARGLEADDCYYIGSLEKVRGRDAIDLNGDPPPDLAVEIDVTSPGVAKLPIYAALGVPEVWVWADESLTAHRLNDAGEYETVNESRELPGFPLTLAADLIARRADAPQFELLAEFRTAVRGAGG